MGQFIQEQHVQHVHAPEQSKPSPYYLPAFNPAAFVGRNENLRTLEQWTARPGMSLLSGEPGSGKSTLALMLAWQAQEKKRFAAVVFQTCGRRSVEIIAGDLADTLRGQLADNVTSWPAERKLRAVKHWLGQQPSLLVLDDLWLEPLSPAQNDQLHWQDLLPGPQVTIVFTSRRSSLPGVTVGQTLHVEAFTEAECELAFARYLEPEMVKRYRQDLLEFAGRVERLPIAVVVGADLLRRQWKPLDVAQRGLTIETLRNEVQNVSDLFQSAITSQGENEQKLLAGAAVCVPESFWLPLAGYIGGLEAEHLEEAAAALAHSSLLQLNDGERDRFHLHSLLYEQLRQSAPSLQSLQEKHAQVLRVLFEHWETDWKYCRECLPEIIPAVHYLHTRRGGAGARLSYYGYETARRIGELDAALRMARENESLWRRGESEEEKDGLQASYGNQAVILQAWGRLEEAMALLKKQEALCLELDNKDGLQASYGNQALLLKHWGRLEEAMALHKKEEALCVELGNQNELQTSYGNQAVILQAWSRLEEAMALHKKEEALCAELGEKHGLQRSYGNQALILKTWGRTEEARALHKKEEAICLELGDKSGMAYCYWNWGRLAREMKDHKTATEKLQAALEIFTELKMPRLRNAVENDLNIGTDHKA